MRHLKKEVVLISAFRSVLNKEENLDRHMDLQNSLKSMGFGFKEVVGVYKGTMELTFVVDVSNDSTLETLKALSSHFEQECILFLDSDRRASLIYKNGSTENIGEFKNVSKEVARKQDAYTLDERGYYYTCI